MIIDKDKLLKVKKKYKIKNVYRNIFYDFSPPIHDSYDNSSDEVIFLIPLFPKSLAVQPARDYMKSALWVRHSILCRSNIIEKRIPIKFYIEKSYYEENIEYLTNHNIKEDDCILFDWKDEYKAKEFHDTSQANLALCLLPMLDDRLLKYKRVIISDADMVLCTMTPNAYDIQYLAFSTESDKIGVFNKTSEPKYSPPSNWMNKFKDMDEFVFRSQLQGMFPNNTNLETKFITTNGSIYIINPSRLHITHPQFRNICNRLIPIFRDDEAVISIYRQFINEICTTIDSIEYCTRDRKSISTIENGEDSFFFHSYSDVVETILFMMGGLDD